MPDVNRGDEMCGVFCLVALGSKLQAYSLDNINRLREWSPGWMTRELQITH